MARTEREPPADDAPEHVKARYWREHVVKLSRPELSRLIGWSVTRITHIEEGGHRSTGVATSDANMTRYRMSCATVMLGATFDWREVTIAPPVPVSLTIRAQEP